MEPTPDNHEWHAALGARNQHEETPEWRGSCDSYVRTMWDFIDDPDAPPLSAQQVRARLRALKAVKADLLRLVAMARSGEIEGPSNHVQRRNEWSFPVAAGRSVHPMGELRYPPQRVRRLEAASPRILRRADRLARSADLVACRIQARPVDRHGLG